MRRAAPPVERGVTDPDVAADLSRAHNGRMSPTPSSPESAAEIGPLPGTPYVLLRKLDEGGMAEVYVARHAGLDREDALKFLPPAMQADAQATERLRREARALARLCNPHIVELHAFDVAADGRMYLAMRLVGGENLRRHARRRGEPFPPGEAWALLRPIALALQAAHDVGIVHRDLKPQNIMVEPREAGVFPVLLDFGVALSGGDEADRLTRRGQMFGTPNYMAPEQIAGEPTDGRADQHALAIVLYSLLCGRLPHDADEPLQVIACKMMKPPVGLAGRTPGVEVDPRVAAVVMRSLSRAPEARFDSMRAFVAALDAALPAAEADPASFASSLPIDAGDADPTVAGSIADSSISLVPEAPARGYLPAEHDRFVGRVDDLRALRALFHDDVRAVTLLGLGGTGKTRLALRYAGLYAGEWPGGVWFCDLAEARTEEAIVDQVAAVLGVPLLRGEHGEQLALAIAARGESLIVLDNLEQVVAPARRVVAGWLDRAPNARFLLTSRERLGVDGEHVLALGPLSPEDALSLFERRARAARHDFELSDPDRAVVAALCELLDRLPLAVELAAARVRLWSPRALLERMTDRFRVLTGGTGRPERQSTLRKALDWSWELLDTAERAVLAQLSVFRGGFDLEAVEAVVDPGNPDLWSADVLQALVDKSLVRPVGGDRFELLQMVQAYAAERLTGEITPLEARHGRHFAALGSAASLAGLRGPRAGSERGRLRASLPNLLEAHGRAVRRGDAPVAAACARASWAIMEDEGPCGRGAELLASALSAGSASAADDHATRLALGQAHRLSGDIPAAEACLRDLVAATTARAAALDRGRALHALGALLCDLARFTEARAAFEAAEPLIRAHGEPAGIAHLASDVARVLWESGDARRAEARIREGLEVAQRLGDRHREGVLLGHLVLVTSNETPLAERVRAIDAAIAVHRQVGNRRAEAAALNNRGQWCVALGQLEDAHATYDRALTIHREIGHRLGEAIGLASLARVYFFEGVPVLARMCAEQSLALHRSLGSRQYECLSRWGLAELALFDRRPDEALGHLREVDAIRDDLGPRFEDGILYSAEGAALQQLARPAAALEALRRSVDHLSKGHDGGFDRSLALYRMASVLVDLGRPDEARGCLTDARARGDLGHLRADSPFGRLVAAVDAALE
jgi:predicted ATPase/serine/threonine protein kinase